LVDEPVLSETLIEAIAVADAEPLVCATSECRWTRPTVAPKKIEASSRHDNTRATGARRELNIDLALLLTIKNTLMQLRLK
jgi:hypothetical protein